MRGPRDPEGWRADLAAVGTAVGELLVLGAAPRPAPMADPARALAARDRVVAGLRALLDGTGHAPTEQDSVVTLSDLSLRPGTALHAALGLLPPAGPGDRPAPSDGPTRSGTGYEQAWHSAARGLLALEGRWDTLPRSPSPAAAQLLADVADLAGVLEALDTDLLTAVTASNLHGLAEAGRALTDPAGHTAVRVSVLQCRLHVTPSGPPPSGRPRDVEPVGVRPPGGRQGLAGLAGATDAVVEVLGGREGRLSAVELRAVAGLLEAGAAHTASTLRRAAPALPGAARVADELLAVADAAATLRRCPVRSLVPPSPTLPLLTGQVRGQLARLAALSTRLPASTPKEDLHRLARPALTWAGQITPLSDALTAAVRSTLAAGLLAVPTDVRARGRTALLWAPASASPEPPRVLTQAEALRTAARRLPLALTAVTLPAPARPASVAAGRAGTAVRAAARTAGTAPPARTQPAGQVVPGSEHALPSRRPGPLPSNIGHAPSRRAR